MDSSEPKTQSTFVTVVAWIFIVFAGFGVLMTTAQNILISFMPVIPAPPNPSFMERNFRLLFLLPWIISVLMLVSSIGLLKRLRWAWKAFIGLLSLGVIWCTGTLVVVYFMGFGTPPPPPAGASEAYRESMQQFDSFRIGIQVFSTIFALFMAGLFIWIIRKLISPDIENEFAP